MQLHESGEMYLETILILKERFGYVRSIDIAHELNFSKPSVSRAISLLRENDYVTFDPNGMILLTEKGQIVAEKIYERHNVLTRCLMALGVSEENASADACRIEHVISEETFLKIKNHLEEKNPSEQ
ncbi:MAG: metal-dependent transcriptional regulator [Clostridia bacterium]|nr:metal-dependent transcriptional regulator [Clostridia bacterium]